MTNYDTDTLNLIKGDTPKQKHDNLKAIVDTTKAGWSDEVRLEMLEKAELYNNNRVYHYGYYDGYMKALSSLTTNLK